MLRASLAQAHLLVYGVLVVVVILVMPEGIVGFASQRLRRRKAAAA
jgi:ABC-type branched-subunit amino acid transport system permease subunit